jgi:hypothetical protein
MEEPSGWLYVCVVTVLQIDTTTALPPPRSAVAETLVVSVIARAVIEVVVAVSVTGAVGVCRADIIIVAPVHHTESTGISFLSNWTIDTLPVDHGVPSVAFAVGNCVITFFVKPTFRVCGALKIGIAPLEHTVAAGIKFSSRWAYGDTYPIFKVEPMPAGLTRVPSNQDFVGRAGTVIRTAYWANGYPAFGNQVTTANDAWITPLRACGRDFGTGRASANVRTGESRLQVSGALALIRYDRTDSTVALGD